MVTIHCNRGNENVCVFPIETFSCISIASLMEPLLVFGILNFLIRIHGWFIVLVGWFGFIWSCESVCDREIWIKKSKTYLNTSTVSVGNDSWEVRDSSVCPLSWRIFCGAHEMIFCSDKSLFRKTKNGLVVIIIINLHLQYLVRSASKGKIDENIIAEIPRSFWGLPKPPTV